MQRQQIQPYLFVLGIALALTSCFNEPNYSNTPEIFAPEVERYRVAASGGVGGGRRDSIVITIKFKDGDGNLGDDFPLPKADSLRYRVNGGWGNYRITTLRLVDGKYVEVPVKVNETLFFPNLTKGKPSGAIEGDLEFNQLFQYGNSTRLFPTKFRIQVRDRALNESNVIETDTLNLPFLR